jgi:hypothetical protein
MNETTKLTPDEISARTFTRLLKQEAEQHRATVQGQYQRLATHGDNWRADDTARDFAFRAESVMRAEAKASLYTELERWIDRVEEQHKHDFRAFSRAVSGEVSRLVESVSHQSWNNNSLNLEYLQATVQAGEWVRGLLFASREPDVD